MFPEPTRLSIPIFKLHLDRFSCFYAAHGKEFIYTVNHEKRGSLFLTITLATLNLPRFYGSLCTLKCALKRD